MDGVFVIDKPAGWTSSDVVIKIRNRLKVYGKPKVGHMGTLDPAGTGVLVIGVGKGTKLFDKLLKATKIYEAGFVFGIETDTLDGEGKVIAQDGAEPTEEQFLQAATAQVGLIDQIPPKYSRINVNGQRALKLARSGVDFELKPRPVNVYSLELKSTEQITEKYTGKKVNEFRISVTCEGGTYVRSLVRDIAYDCGTIGYMSYIRRCKSGQFDLSQAELLENVLAEPEKYLIPLESVTI